MSTIAEECRERKINSKIYKNNSKYYRMRKKHCSELKGNKARHSNSSEMITNMRKKLKL